MDDFIELAVPVATTSDSVALTLRLRNSLLNTVLLYDGMLGAGPRALDWVGRDLKQISTAVSLGRWYAKHMGLRIAVLEGGTWRAAGRLTDAGPIAWHDVAVVVPARREPGAGDTVRVRLSFTVDDWRVDQVAVAESYRRPATRSIPVAMVRDAHERVDTAAIARLRAPDEEYVVTTPGTRFKVTFDAGTVPSGTSRTFLLSSQGYYIEWMRGDWLRTRTSAQGFVPNDSALLGAVQRWRVKREAFERQFFSSRVGVR
jgi:hypothetical protein